MFFFFAAGVLYYLEEVQVKDIFNKLSNAFPSSELIFDAASPFGVNAANQQFIKKVGLDEKSFLKWGLQNADDIKTWGIKLEYIKEFPMYKHMRQRLSLKNKLISVLSDKYKVMYMVHLKF